MLKTAESHIKTAKLAPEIIAVLAPELDANKRLGWYITGALMLCISLQACTTPAPSAQPPAHYRCEFGIEFTPKFVDNTVTLDGTRGYDVLSLQAPQEKSQDKSKTYSNPRMTAQFNLGESGREAILRYPLLPLVARCVRD